MRISAKGRYAIAAMIELAAHYGDGQTTPVIMISENLDISKIYLEQVFALLKRGGLVKSIKGAQGGYQLTKTPSDITVLSILEASEAGLFEAMKETVSKKAPEMDRVLASHVFEPLDEAIRGTLSQTTLEDLKNQVDYYRSQDVPMYYI